MDPVNLISAARHQQDLMQTSMATDVNPALCSYEQSSVEDDSRYRGICTCPGNPLFSNTPVIKPNISRPTRITDVDNISRPYRHPLYQTTSLEYGRIPNVGNVPVSFCPKSTEFTSRQHLGANYEDAHFTTNVEKVFTGV